MPQHLTTSSLYQNLIRDIRSVLSKGLLAARRFLKKYLAENSGIIIRSHKEEMYGRWLADVFAMKPAHDPFTIAREGVYINQLLIDRGLAEVYENNHPF